MPRPFGEIQYTLTDLIVAKYDPVADTYGTPVRIDDGQMFVSEPESDNDKMRGYGVITRGLSVPIGSKISLKAGGCDSDAMEAIANFTNSISGTSGNYIRKTIKPAGGAGLPYFGVLGVAATEGGGKSVIGLRAVMLDAIPKSEFNGEENKYVIYETEGYSFVIDTGVLETMKTYQAAADFSAPVSGAAFKTWFTS